MRRYTGNTLKFGKIKSDERCLDLPVSITVEAETIQLGEITKPLFLKEED